MLIVDYYNLQVCVYSKWRTMHGDSRGFGFTFLADKYHIGYSSPILLAISSVTSQRV